jgi:filamentous hemagglutinin family protein
VEIMITPPAKTRGMRRIMLQSLTAFFGATTCLCQIAPAMAEVLPEGGVISSGQGNIVASASGLTVNQASDWMSLDWQSFSIGENRNVNFSQPNASSVALNRVVGGNPSEILGGLTANGRVFLVNPAGITFGPGAEVNVGSLVASTLDVVSADQGRGSFKLQGVSDRAVVNRGQINARDGGSVALLAANITNEGSISADGGTVALGAGNRVQLDLGGPVQLEVEGTLVDTLINQGGALRADGGTILINAKAAGDLASSVINHTGSSQARTLATGEKGGIYIVGDMQKGRLNVGGRIDASAPNGGDGGFIDTSAASVRIEDTASITTNATYGKTGTWLIDPQDITISLDTCSGANCLSSQVISQSLLDNNITIATAAETAGNGDIFLNSGITYTGSAARTLTFRSHRDIRISAPIVSDNGPLSLVLNPIAGAIIVNAAGGIKTRGGSFTAIGGNDPINGAAGRFFFQNGSIETNGGSFSVNVNGALRPITQAQWGTFGRGVVQLNGSIDTAGGSLSINSNGAGTSGEAIIQTASSTLNSGSGNITLNAQGSARGLWLAGNLSTSGNMQLTGSSIVDDWTSYGVVIGGILTNLGGPDKSVVLNGRGATFGVVTYTGSGIPALVCCGAPGSGVGEISLPNGANLEVNVLVRPVGEDWGAPVAISNLQTVGDVSVSVGKDGFANWSQKSTGAGSISGDIGGTLKIRTAVAGEKIVFNGLSMSAANALTFNPNVLKAAPKVIIGHEGKDEGEIGLPTTADLTGASLELWANTVSGATTVTGGKIVARAVGVFSAQDKIFDGNADALLEMSGVVLRGVVSTDNVGLGSKGSFASSSVGAHIVSIASDLFGADANKYVVSSVGRPTTIAQINARPLTITANSAEKELGSPDPVLTYSIGGMGLVGNDAVTGVLSRQPGETLGRYMINQGTLNANSNYSISFVGSELLISRRQEGGSMTAVSGLTQSISLALAATTSLTTRLVSISPSRTSSSVVSVNNLSAGSTTPTATVSSGGLVFSASTSFDGSSGSTEDDTDQGATVESRSGVDQVSGVITLQTEVPPELLINRND